MVCTQKVYFMHNVKVHRINKKFNASLCFFGEEIQKKALIWLWEEIVFLKSIKDVPGILNSFYNMLTAALHQKYYSFANDSILKLL